MTDLDPAEALEAGDPAKAASALNARRDAAPEERKRALRRLRAVADGNPELLVPLVDGVAAFLTDETRPIRLAAVKLLAAVAAEDPASVLRVCPAVADRLADDEELSFVRARAAETVGAVAVEHPEEAATPAVLADLTIGLAFDEPEVRTELARALERIAVGDPSRLAHRVETVADHLDDDEELVRYHLLTAILAVACARPERVDPVRSLVVDRLDDESPYVRGRAAELLGVLGPNRSDDDDPPALSPSADAEADGYRFEAARTGFTRVRLAGCGVDRNDDAPESSFGPDSLGTVDGVRSTSEAVVEAIRRTDERPCPHCGGDLPDGAPVCPSCGSPL